MKLINLESTYYFILLAIVVILILYNGLSLFKELFRAQYNKLGSIYDTINE